MTHYHRLPLVDCPTCISRAPWVSVDHTDPRALPSAVEWFTAPDGSRLEPARRLAEKIGASHLWFNNADPSKAVFMRVYRKECDATVFYKRDQLHISQARKGYQCNGCADREEGAW